MNQGVAKERTQRTMLQKLSSSNPDAGYVALALDDFKDEVVSVLAAASNITWNGLTVAAYNLVQTRKVYQRVRAELKAAFPDPKREVGLHHV